MRVLVACEFSGIVRDAFTVAGHYAVSCDLLPSETEGRHIQDDVLNHIDKRWDLIIAHPPCTYLSGAGAHLWHQRTNEIQSSFEFVKKLYNADCERVAIENPQGWLNTYCRKPDQTIHPWKFGHPYKKRTCLWLYGLPLLRYTNIIEGVKQSWVNSGNNYRNNFGEGWTKGVTRKSEDRSRSFRGIAKAMAEQWGVT